MIVSPAYCTRESVMRGLDVHPTVRTTGLVDAAVMAATNDVYGLLHRRFYPEDGIKYFDWPNFEYAYPWRIWFNQYDLVAATSVTTGGQTISLDDIFFEPVDKEAGEPFTYMELNRSTSASFGVGPTPQHDVAITGTWGYCDTTVAAGSLAADVTDSAGSLTVSDGSQMGVGDLLVCGSERILVADRGWSDAGETGTLTDAKNAVSLTVGSGADYAAGEVLLLDAEQMLITGVAGNTLIVDRAWNGSTLAAHTGAEIYASRLLTVLRGQLGTTAAAHTADDTLSRHQPPPLVSELAHAFAENGFLQKTSGYSRTVGEGDNARSASGAGLADLCARTVARYGRKARSGVI